MLDEFFDALFQEKHRGEIVPSFLLRIRSFLSEKKITRFHDSCAFLILKQIKIKTVNEKF